MNSERHHWCPDCKGPPGFPEDSGVCAACKGRRWAREILDQLRRELAAKWGETEEARQG